MKLAANISMMFTELAFPDRIAAAASAGFRWIECMFPYEFAAEELLDLARRHNVQFVLINAPAGDWAAGDRGLASDPDRVDEFKKSIPLALHYAKALGINQAHVLAGCYPKSAEAGDLQHYWSTYRSNLEWLAEQEAPTGFHWLIEPINTRDVPGYLLNYQAQAHDLITAIGSDRLRVQMDLYHCQIMEGDILTRLRAALASGRLGHIQIAGVPERHEPNDSELNYRKVFDLLETMAYQGAVGCEYRPRGDTLEGLGWVQQLGLTALLRTQGDRR